MDTVDITLEEAFARAVQFQQDKDFKTAQIIYSEILKKKPNHLDSLNNLGSIFQNLGEDDKAKNCYEKVITIEPNYPLAYYNLGNILKKKGELQKAISCHEKAIAIKKDYINPYINLGVIYQELQEDDKAKDYYEKVIEIDPNYSIAHNNLGNVLKKKGEHQTAISCFKKAIKINLSFKEAHFNLGVMFHELGKYNKAKDSYEKVIEIDPNYVKAHNNLAQIFHELGQDDKAKKYYEKAIEIDPDFRDVYWNLHSTASSIDEAITILKKLYKIDKTYIKAKIMISALQGYQGNFDEFNSILLSSESSHPYSRSVKWVFSLPKLPKLFFNRWNFFDFAVGASNSLKPFYEFGVWNANSFQYLINTFKQGFGFDTFTGIPEAWHDEPEGKYSAFGAIPKIEGGEFIVGKFEDTLPKFFAQERPVASLINFDADLYSSTLCALNNSNKVIDENTILVFDEFIMNDKWEEDEYKALNEFCENLGYSYEVIAVSFFTKQVAIKLKKILNG